MNKYYNDNDCANNIFELHASKFSGNHQFKSIAYLLGELLHDGMSMNDISKAITYDVADIVSMIVKCDNIAIFSVWTGGTEVNDHMLTIADALSKFDAYADDGYDDEDLKIGAYTLLSPLGN